MSAMLIAQKEDTKRREGDEHREREKYSAKER